MKLMMMMMMITSKSPVFHLSWWEKKNPWVSVTIFL